VRFSKLHEKRADVIQIFYRLLVEAEKESRSFVVDKQGRRSQEQIADVPAVAKLYELWSFADIHRIYLPASICSLLEAFNTALGEPLAHALSYGDIDCSDDTFRQEKQVGFMKAYDAFRQGIPAARKALEQEIRKMLGEN